MGVPRSDYDHRVLLLTMNVPAGTYIVNVDGIAAGGAVPSLWFCFAIAHGITYLTTHFSVASGSDYVPFGMTNYVSAPNAGPIELYCDRGTGLPDSGTNTVEATMTAIAIDTVN